MFFCIIYHPEFRRAFTTLFSGRARLFRIGSQTTVEQIDTILNACENLVQVKRGALIIFPRHTDIKSVIDSGTKLNADLSSSLICTIFDRFASFLQSVISSSKNLISFSYSKAGRFNNSANKYFDLEKLLK